MKYACVDIGTNSVLLLIADIGTGLRDIVDIARTTRLGEGLKKEGMLRESAMHRTLDVLEDYGKIIHEQGVDNVFCIGTAALREAGNSDVFLEKVKNRAGFRARVLTGSEEAFYTYLSVRHDNTLNEDDFIVMDIGGGSTEIVNGEGKKFAGYVSLPVGAVKLTEIFIHNDPPAMGEIKSLRGFIRGILRLPFGGRGLKLIGVGGTVTTLAGNMLGLVTFDKSKIHGLIIHANEIQAWIDRQSRITVDRRQRQKGMESGRADIILQGVILLKEIMNYFGVRDIIVSTHGIRYGIIYESVYGNTGCEKGRVEGYR